MTLLSVRGLTVTAETSRGQRQLVSGLDLDVPPSTIVGLVGESGSGKSMTSLAIMGLLPPGVTTTAGEVLLGGVPMARPTRRNGPGGVTMVFQNARAALNPTMRISRQLLRAIRLGGAPDPSSADVLPALDNVGIADPERVARSFPHQLSGGMCQRVMIAMALAAKPQLLIADEPTTGLDVTVQAQILLLLRDVTAQAGCSVLLITHDLGVIATVCDEVIVMKDGVARERGTTTQVFHSPTDPYTRELLGAELAAPAAIDTASLLDTDPHGDAPPAR